MEKFKSFMATQNPQKKTPYTNETNRITNN